MHCDCTCQVNTGTGSIFQHIILSDCMLQVCIMPTIAAELFALTSLLRQALSRCDFSMLELKIMQDIVKEFGIICFGV